MITVTLHNPHTVILSMCVKRELNVSSSDPHTVILSMCVKRELNVNASHSGPVGGGKCTI